MGIDQPKVSALLSGRLINFSSERLMRLLTRLGQDVEIVVNSKPRRRLRGRIRVVQEPRPQSEQAALARFESLPPSQTQIES